MPNKKARLVKIRLEKNFHESVFFLEIKYKKNPTKEMKEKLIEYYIKGVEYYNSINEKDLSLSFQTKLLYLMKKEDYFENIINSRNKDLLEEKIEREKAKKILKEEKDIDERQRSIINGEIQKQKDQFLSKLSQKKKNKKLKKVITRRFSYNKNVQLGNSIRNSVRIFKKSSLELASMNNKLNKDNSNSIFNKIDNILIDLNKINTLLIIDYTKNMKHYAKFLMDSIEKKTDKYMNYKRVENDLNLLYEDLPDKDADDAKTIKSQIDANRDEWELYEKKEDEETKGNGSLSEKISDKNLALLSEQLLDNILKKSKELIKENEN